MSDEIDEQAYGSWGPRHTSIVVGHAAAEQGFLEAWQSGKLPHAWLITGPKGVGKMTLALRIARFLLVNGTKPEEDAGGLFGPAAPPDSLNLRADNPELPFVLNNAHPDLHILEVEPEKKGIIVGDRDNPERNSSRGLKTFFSMTASRAKARVSIVDAADDLNINAANALLKILEEPPANTVLLLVSHAPGSLLPTIRSRCRRLALQPLEPLAMQTALAKLLPDLSEAERQALVVAAEGSPGRAVALGGQGGLELLRDLLDLIAGLPKPDAAKLHALGDKLGRATGAESFRVMVDLFRWWLARLVRAAASGKAGGPGWAELFQGEAALAARLASWQAPDRWAEDWEAIGRLLDRGESVNLDRKQLLLNLFAILGRPAEAATRR